MKILSAAIGAIVAVSIPAAAFAATYQYVSTDGSLKELTADTSAQALAMPSDLATHSGVSLMLGNSGTEDASAAAAPASSVSATMTKAADLQAAMHDLLTEHVSASIDVLRDINDGNSDALQGALQEQDANAIDLAAAIGSVYGTDAGNSFLDLFRAHIKDSNAYTQGLKDGSVTDQQQALADLDSQLVQISDFLSGANPNIDNATILAALRQHESLINQSSQAYHDGEYDQAYDLERQAITQIAGGADYLSGAIVKQYPDKFPGSTTSKASTLRASMNDLLTEHVSASLDVLRDISDGDSKAMAGALKEQDANAVDLAAAIGSVYGSDAQAAFLKDFRDHISASNAYTQGLKDGSMTDQKAALAALDAQLVNITDLLSGANPNIDNATLLAALRAHEDLINNASEAYNGGSVSGSYELVRKAVMQIEGGADYLANAIVLQYPDKF